MKFLKTSAFVLATTLVSFSCGSPSETVETTEAQEVGEVSGDTLHLDITQSEVSWRGYKPTGQHYGIIPITSGNLLVAGDKVKGGKINFDVTKLEVHDLEEGSSNHVKLTTHLQSDDFFDAANFPEASFEITAVEPYSAGDKVDDKEEFVTENTPKKASELRVENPTHWVSGNLTIRGTSKNIKFPAAINTSNGSASAVAGFNIDRTEWGLSYGDEAGAVDKARDRFIYNTVNVEFDIRTR
ncbi:MAG TPA: YceI family protein [Cyclobacteriaceae bacterium]|nr:YceI family protein [Cyclobacteriaceae bacterium]